MSVLSDRWIKKFAIEKNMIHPFVEKQKGDKNISYGLSSFGYDARVSNEFKIFTNVNSEIVDPKNLSHQTLLQKMFQNVLFHPIHLS